MLIFFKHGSIFQWLNFYPNGHIFQVGLIQHLVEGMLQGGWLHFQ